MFLAIWCDAVCNFCFVFVFWSVMALRFARKMRQQLVCHLYSLKSIRFECEDIALRNMMERSLPIMKSTWRFVLDVCKWDKKMTCFGIFLGKNYNLCWYMFNSVLHSYCCPILNQTLSINSLIFCKWICLTRKVCFVLCFHRKCVLAPLAPCSLGFCPPAAAVTLHYSQSAKWNIILNICIVISSVTLTRTRVNKAINHSGTSKLFCNSS